MNKPFRIFVPRMMDDCNFNAQNLNAKALLSRFSSEHTWVSPHYFSASSHIERLKNIELTRLLHKRLWRWELFLQYQKKFDAIFYPGIEQFEYNALRTRAITRRKLPIIATMEGVLGNPALEKKLAEWMGHPVYSQRVNNKVLKRANYLYRHADHIIAISPFVARVGTYLYGDKFSTLPLGVDLKTFYPAATVPKKFTVVSAGRLYENKQPFLFVEMALQFPQVNFIWYGEGELKSQLLQEIKAKKIKNLFFPGALPHTLLANAFRKANLFISTSLSEGFSKATQEAMACGLPAIAFGFYESYLIKHEYNGYIVWNKSELLAKLAELVATPRKAVAMGKCANKLIQKLDWDVIAPLWEDKLIKLFNYYTGGKS